jgi:glycosyltransferase involved in cell wall biosynthesis
VVSFGRLGPQKGFDVLLRAFAAVSPAHPDWELAIFGAGPDLESLRALAGDLGLQGRIRFPGRVKDPHAVMRCAGLYVLSSRFEGFPNALCEAMACGMPVIATDCPTGPREIITDGVDGLLVPNEDAAAMASAMDRLMGDEALRKELGSRASLIAARFSLDAVMSQWEAVLREKCGVGA